MSKKQCAYCVYMDPKSVEKGKYYCEKKSDWKYANSTDADDCYSYCERWRKDMYISDEMIKTSEEYLKSNTQYKSLGLCYLTTMCSIILGMEDNCEELMMMRKLRKDYMQKNESCKEMLIKYDALGPSIAKKIYSLPERKEIAEELFTIFIKGCSKYVKCGKYEKAVVLYNEMMEGLYKKYITSYMIPNRAIEAYDIDNAGHGRITLRIN